MDNDLFGFNGVQPLRQGANASPQGKQSKPSAPPPAKPAGKKADNGKKKQPERSDPVPESETTRRTVSPENVTEKPGKQKDPVMMNIETVCNGNKYLECMIMGEILNSPRFKYRK